MQLCKKLEIYVVDRSEESLAISKTRASEIDSLMSKEEYEKFTKESGN